MVFLFHCPENFREISDTEHQELSTAGGAQGQVEGNNLKNLSPKAEYILGFYTTP